MLETAVLFLREFGTSENALRTLEFLLSIRFWRQEKPLALRCLKYLSETRRKALDGQCAGGFIQLPLTYYMLHKSIWKDGNLLTGTDFPGHC